MADTNRPSLSEPRRRPGRWQGKCDACGEWNTIGEENAATARPQMPGRAPRGRLFALEPLAGQTARRPAPRLGIAEFDRVTGGGFVRGSVLLLGGDPGIGKSTLLIQVAAIRLRAPATRVYISGEEAVAQVRLRAERPGWAAPRSSLRLRLRLKISLQPCPTRRPASSSSSTSIQTMWTDGVESGPRTSRRCAAARALIRFAARSGAAVILVGHVTKDGQIAGPRVVEHMVDAVLSFEGEGSHPVPASCAR